MDEHEDALAKTMLEIMKYVDNSKQYSFYELKAYMLKNRPEWEPVFNDKRTRAALATYLKSKRKSNDVKVKAMFESYDILLKTEEELLQKKEQNEGE